MYTLVIYDGIKLLCPIWTVLSEMNNANFICFWLREWLRLGGTAPEEFCADMSLALLNAGVCAFTEFGSLSDYINAVFVLNFDDKLPVPKVMIRIDVAHLLNNVAKFKHFVDKRPKVRETYIRCVALLVRETNFLEAEELIRSILIIAYASSEGKH